MTLYSVFDRRLDEPPAVVPDRFSWFAALLPPVYGIAHGLWLATLGWVGLLLAIAGAGLWLGGEAAFWLYVLLAVLAGFEAPALRRRQLRHRGWVYRSERLATDADLVAVDWMKRRAAP